MRGPLQKLKSYLFPTLLFLFSFLLYLSLISKGPYHNDTLWLVIESENVIKTHHLSYSFGPGYVLATILGALSISLTKIFSLDDPVFAINLISVVFGALCIPTTYGVVKKLLDSTAATFSSLLITIFPLFFGLSTYGKNHTPAVFFLLFTIFHLLSFLETKKRKNLIVAGVSLGLMGATRMQDAILILPALCTLLTLGVRNNRKKISAKFKACISLIAVALITALVLFLPLFFSEDKRTFYQLLSSFWASGVSENFRGIFSPSLFWCARYSWYQFLPMTTILIVCGLIYLLKNSPRIFVFFGVWFLVPLAFYGNLHSIVPRFLMISFIPLLIAMGYILSLLFKYHVYLRASAVMILATILSLWFLEITPILYFRHQHALMPDFARWLSVVTPSDAEIISGDDGLFMDYYGKRKFRGRPSGVFEPIKVAELKDFKNNLDLALEKGTAVYITSHGLFTYDPERIFSRFLDGHYQLTFIGAFPYEDWHRGETILRIGRQALYKIDKKF